ncbi:MAG: bifunctional D-glycero-beta-D-manno-heptose-7-phosphate kinase/D-glycero-beta-D-manno-heptose 1-phosphate adenylyltransferase HldE [Pseudomonadales bacterium]
MKTVIPNFEGKQVLVLGDLMLDRYWAGPTSRISPEAPVPVTRVDEQFERPGGAGNVALNITSLGCGARLLGYVGDDESAQLLASALQKAGVICQFQAVSGQQTVTKLRVLSRNQQLMRLDFEKGFADVNPAELHENYKQAIAGCGAIVLSDYGKGTLTNTQQLIEMARAANVPVLVDPKGSDFSKYRNASLITPNQAEFEAVVGPCADDEDLLNKGEQLRSELGLDALLVTRSERGMVLFQRDKQAVTLPTRAQEVFDVTGAGDTVIGTLAAAIAAGENFESAMQLSNLAAGVVVGKIGTATASVAELQQAMLTHEPLPRGISGEDQLLETLALAKANNERIVMTNGCFDILHAGHVAYLSSAAELGDRLIVAVNDDDSVKRLKGEGRPVNGVQQRMAVLSGLESVDWVVPFGEDTPARLIEKLLPDTLVKGGDYVPEDIAGGDAVIANGGEVRVLQFIDGLSTSAIISAIKKRV